jgi:hypothetical protein
MACKLTARPKKAGSQEQLSDWNPHERSPSSGGAARASAGLARRFAALRLSIHRSKQPAGNRIFADLAASIDCVFDEMTRSTEVSHESGRDLLC